MSTACLRHESCEASPIDFERDTARHRTTRLAAANRQDLFGVFAVSPGSLAPRLGERIGPVVGQLAVHHRALELRSQLGLLLLVLLTVV